MTTRLEQVARDLRALVRQNTADLKALTATVAGLGAGNTDGTTAKAYARPVRPAVGGFVTPASCASTANNSPTTGLLAAYPFIVSGSDTFDALVPVVSVAASGGAGLTVTAGLWPGKADGTGPDLAAGPLATPGSATPSAQGALPCVFGAAVTPAAGRVWGLILYTHTTAPSALSFSMISTATPYLPGTTGTQFNPARALQATGQSGLPAAGSALALSPSNNTAVIAAGLRRSA